ncbi:MAG: FkbM family methyltransferase [Caldilineaceae bacterium]|mgnify:CR=1 FL=1|nr:FkbM family methyltransferase [Caldilineaceae bacterium]HRJ44940.1 FkbM family methyltransferase [Caldilineaceae bacterium]
MARLARSWGLARSLAIYYGLPGRAGKDRAFYRQFVQPGALVFDIGAHVGNRLRVLRQLGAVCVAVEPQPIFADLLQHFYGRDGQVVLVREAIGAVAGEATLHISRHTPTVTTLSPGWMAAVQRADSFADVRWEETVTVPVTTLDALIARHGLPDFCKIDVEGSELAVLEGLSVALPLLSFEYIPATQEMALGCIERLQALGDYRYNWSVGEEQRLASNVWLGAEEVAERLGEMGVNEKSGDLYARRIE